MLSVSATQTVGASREELFAFLDEPANQVRVAPSLTGVADVRPKAGGGKRLLYGYAAFGLVFTGSLETTTYDPPERIVFRMDGDVVGEIRWTLESVSPQRTRFTYAADYDLSDVPGGWLLRVPFRWYNELELRRTVRNVARLVETGDTDREDFERSPTEVSADAAGSAREAARDESAGEPGRAASDDAEPTTDPDGETSDDEAERAVD